MPVQRTISPIDGSVYVERELASGAQLDATLARAARASRDWRRVPLAERAALCTRLVQHMVDRAPELGEQLTRQMGRPIRDTPGELAARLRGARTLHDRRRARGAR